MGQMSPLRRRMIEDMTVRNLAPATQQSYLYAVARFSRHFACSPDRLGLEHVRAYQVHLAAQKRSWSHINQASCALRFFYGVTLGRSEVLAGIISAREPQKLPVVLSADEIVQFLEAVPGLRNRAALTTAYGAGLRVGEVSRLKLTDIDSGRKVIRIEQGTLDVVIPSPATASVAWRSPRRRMTAPDAPASWHSAAAPAPIVPAWWR